MARTVGDGWVAGAVVAGMGRTFSGGSGGVNGLLSGRRLNKVEQDTSNMLERGGRTGLGEEGRGGSIARELRGYCEGIARDQQATGKLAPSQRQGGVQAAFGLTGSGGRWY